MTDSNLVKDIVFLASTYYGDGTASMFSLLKETGYFDRYSQIGEPEIFEMVNRHPECISDWLHWSEDKRVTSGWYFKQLENGRYQVGYFPQSNDAETFESLDRKIACTKFIQKEIEEIRKY